MSSSPSFSGALDSSCWPIALEGTGVASEGGGLTEPREVLMAEEGAEDPAEVFSGVLLAEEDAERPPVE